jgi:Mg2+-importing ATPase
MAISALPSHPGPDLKRHLTPSLTETLLKASNLETDQVLAWLGTPFGGLTEEEADRRLNQYGPNEVAHEKTASWYSMLFRNFANPFIVVLLILGSVSYLTGDTKAVIVVGVMVAASVLLRFLQEYRSSVAADRLEAMVRTTATVMRQNEEEESDGAIRLKSDWQEVPIQEVVPGDVVRLSAGDMIPADVRLIESKDLFLSQSVLTGEALPIEKYDTLSQVREKTNPAPGSANGNPLECGNLCFLGTNIVSGSATAAVVSTGSNTMLGALAKNVAGYRSETSFDKGINSVSWVLIRFMLVMVPVIFLVNGLMKGDWKESFLFGIAVAVGLTPEMLPMVVTANLAKGALTMSKEKVIVKRLNSIQNLGAMDILCTDKTGTLTQDKIVLIEYMNIRGGENPLVLEYAYLNSYYQTGLKNLLDRAVLERVELTQTLKIPTTKKIDEIPFDFTRRRMSVVIEQNPDEHLLICKGAIEEILRVCTRAEDGGELVPLTDELKQQVMQLTSNLNEDGLRVVAVAYKKFPSAARPYEIGDESELVLAGFIDFLDPPKESAAAAIQALQRAGISVKIITGDNEIVTHRICKDVQFQVEHITTGSEIEKLSDDALADLAERTTVFAKINPLQKARIIKALKWKNHTVGYLGDGINDAAALRDADVGISVDTGADIAKESADIILLEKSLMVLQVGVIKGREVYGNIIKYIKMTASSNFGNMFSVLAASAFLPFLPMLPIQILVQNLFYDFSQLSIPWDKMNHEFLTKPRKWEPHGIARFMIFIGPISSIFDITTFLVLWNVFGANNIAHQALFQTGWFVEGLLSQTLIVHMIRTPKFPFIQSRAATPVLIMTALVMAAGIITPYTSFGQSVGMVPLPLHYFPWLIGTLLAYCILTQIVKTWYIRRFKTWL